MNPELRPCADADQLRSYIDTYWRRGHVLAADPAMFAFTYCTPWVDRTRFPAGISVLGLYDGGRMLGFLGAIVTPYPRPLSYWLALWHVLPELKGRGQGGKLLQRMQEIAEDCGGWIGTFGAGPEALPVYLKRGFGVRAGRRWAYDPAALATNPLPSETSKLPALHTAELEPVRPWFDYRYRRHPDSGRGSAFVFLHNGDRYRELRLRTRPNTEKVLSVAVGDDGLIHLLDASTSRISTFTPRFRLVRSWQPAASAPNAGTLGRAILDRQAHQEEKPGGPAGVKANV